jgi:hypothetical protein
MKNLINELVTELKSTVVAIEAAPAVTKGHYGRYMAILAAAPSRRAKIILAQALVQAGANKTGVQSALRLAF